MVSLFNSLLFTIGGYSVKLWWRWHSFERDVMKYKQRALELDQREARKIARDHLLRLTEKAADATGLYRFFTRPATKDILRDVISSVQEATRQREPGEGPNAPYFTPGSETKEVWKWSEQMNIASLRIDNPDFGMYGGVGPKHPET